MTDWENQTDTLLFDAIDRWLLRDVEPYVAELERNDEYPVAMVAQMRELGLFGAIISEDYGGLGLNALTYSRIVQKIASVFPSLIGIFNSHLMMAKVVENHGTDEQKEKWLPKFCSGEIRGGVALTEPGAGSDLQGIKTRAARQDDGSYCINGSKTWITNGVHSDMVALLVKTDPTARPAHKGMSLFLAPKGPGFKVGKALPKLGYRSVDAAELFFEDFRVEAELLIGGEEGRGFKMIAAGLEIGRINIAARAVGLAKRALNESLAYARMRTTFGKPICEHQAIQLKLGEMTARIRSSELLTEDAAKAFDRNERCDLEAGIAKYMASETAVFAASEAMRIHGGYGYSQEFPIERLYRDAPVLCLVEGTNEIQQLLIARQMISRHAENGAV